MPGATGFARDCSGRAQRVRRCAGASTCEPARASVSAAVIMSAACPAAASASITSVTASPVSRPSSCVELAVFVLDDQEPRQLLAQLRQARADQLKAGDDVADVAGGVSSPPPCVSSLSTVIACAASAGDLARGHGARQFRHWLTSTSRARGGARLLRHPSPRGTRVGSRKQCMVCPQDRLSRRYGPDYARSAVCNRDPVLDPCGSDAAVAWAYRPLDLLILQSTAMS